jgi:hypothetical protein
MEEKTPADWLQDDSPGPEDLLECKELREVTAQMLGDLEPRLRYIITRYYGLDGEPAYTLEQMGKRMGICRERVRQLHEDAVAVIQKLHGQVPTGTYSSAHCCNRQQIESALGRTMSTGTAARLLGISLGHLLNLCRRYGITVKVRGARADGQACEDSEVSAARLAELMEDDERIARNKALDAVETAIVSTGMVVAT